MAIIWKKVENDTPIRYNPEYGGEVSVTGGGYTSLVAYNTDPSSDSRVFNYIEKRIDYYHAKDDDKLTGKVYKVEIEPTRDYIEGKKLEYARIHCGHNSSGYCTVWDYPVKWESDNDGKIRWWWYNEDTHEKEEELEVYVTLYEDVLDACVDYFEIPSGDAIEETEDHKFATEWSAAVVGGKVTKYSSTYAEDKKMKVTAKGTLDEDEDISYITYQEEAAPPTAGRASFNNFCDTAVGTQISNVFGVNGNKYSPYLQTEFEKFSDNVYTAKANSNASGTGTSYNMIAVYNPNYDMFSYYLGKESDSASAASDLNSNWITPLTSEYGLSPLAGDTTESMVYSFAEFDMPNSFVLPSVATMTALAAEGKGVKLGPLEDRICDCQPAANKTGNPPRVDAPATAGGDDGDTETYTFSIIDDYYAYLSDAEISEGGGGGGDPEAPFVGYEKIGGLIYHRGIENLGSTEVNLVGANQLDLNYGANSVGVVHIKGTLGYEPTSTVKITVSSINESDQFDKVINVTTNEFDEVFLVQGTPLGEASAIWISSNKPVGYVEAFVSENEGGGGSATIYEGYQKINSVMHHYGKKNVTAYANCYIAGSSSSSKTYLANHTGVLHIKGKLSGTNTSGKIYVEMNDTTTHEEPTINVSGNEFETVVLMTNVPSANAKYTLYCNKDLEWVETWLDEVPYNAAQPDLTINMDDSYYAYRSSMTGTGSSVAIKSGLTNLGSASLALKKDSTGTMYLRLRDNNGHSIQITGDTTGTVHAYTKEDIYTTNGLVDPLTIEYNIPSGQNPKNVSMMTEWIKGESDPSTVHIFTRTLTDVLSVYQSSMWYSATGESGDFNYDTATSATLANCDFNIPDGFSSGTLDMVVKLPPNKHADLAMTVIRKDTSAGATGGGVLYGRNVASVAGGGSGGDFTFSNTTDVDRCIIWRYEFTRADLVDKAGGAGPFGLYLHSINVTDTPLPFVTMHLSVQ